MKHFKGLPPGYFEEIQVHEDGQTDIQVYDEKGFVRYMGHGGIGNGKFWLSGGYPRGEPKEGAKPDHPNYKQ